MLHVDIWIVVFLAEFCWLWDFMVHVKWGFVCGGVNVVHDQSCIL